MVLNPDWLEDVPACGTQRGLDSAGHVGIGIVQHDDTACENINILFSMKI
jgi:hypothetical protein